MSNHLTVMQSFFVFNSFTAKNQDAIQKVQINKEKERDLKYNENMLSMYFFFPFKHI